MAKHTIVLIPGDGIGPEVTNATKRVCEAAGLSVEWVELPAGKTAIDQGFDNVLPDRTLAAVRAHKPDVTLMDLSMPRMSGAEAIQSIVTEFPEARVIAVTTFVGDADVHRALEAGARGYLIKDALRHDVAQAIRAVHRGEKVVPAVVAQRLAEYAPRVDLTEREIEVLTHMMDGLSNKEIAGAIGRTEATVKAHLLNIFEKLGASDRTEAVTIALRRGIVHLPDK